MVWLDLQPGRRDRTTSKGLPTLAVYTSATHPVTADTFSTIVINSLAAPVAL
jgi:hypothetical protein